MHNTHNNNTTPKKQETLRPDVRGSDSSVLISMYDLDRISMCVCASVFECCGFFVVFVS